MLLTLILFLIVGFTGIERLPRMISGKMVLLLISLSQNGWIYFFISLLFLALSVYRYLFWILLKSISFLFFFGLGLRDGVTKSGDILIFPSVFCLERLLSLEEILIGMLLLLSFMILTCLSDGLIKKSDAPLNELVWELKALKSVLLEFYCLTWPWLPVEICLRGVLWVIVVAQRAALSNVE